MPPQISAVNPTSLSRPAGFSYGYEIRSGRLLFISGQVARDGKGAVVAPGDLVGQFRQVCQNIKAVIDAAGGQMSDVIKLTIYVLDVSAYKREVRAIGGVYREYFGKHFPAMTLVGARDLYDAEDGCLIEIEGVAALG
jgi:enamine deaminase RidA (YjgF/YER057c/UK114 family)